MHLGGGWGRCDDLEAIEIGPAGDLGGGRIEETEAEGAGEAETGIVGGAAADASNDFTRAMVASGAEHQADAERIQIERMPLAGREEGQAIGFGRLEESAFLGVAKRPANGAGFVGGVEAREFEGLSLAEAAQNFLEAIAAIAHGKELQLIGGANALPALSNGLGGLGGGERAFKFVRDDEDAHGVTGGLRTGLERDWGSDGGRRI